MNILTKTLHGIRYILNHLVLLTTAVVPRNRKMILFGAWKGDKFDDNPRMLFEYIIQNHPEIKAYWISSNPNVVQDVLKRGYNAVNSHSWKAYCLALRARYVYFSLGYGDIGRNLIYCLGGCTLINSWHGIPLKKILNDDKITRGDIGTLSKISNKIRQLVTPKSYVICTSENFRKIYSSAFQTEEKKILNLGQARNDYFFREEINLYRNMYKGKTIIVYMPTHRKEGRVEINLKKILDLHEINQLCKKTNSVFLIKKHYYHRNDTPISRNYENICEITNDNPDTMAVMSTADILITDYSSCFIDFLLLKRPVVFYCYDLKDYLINDREMYFKYDEIVPGPICQTSLELSDTLYKILTGEDMFVEKRKESLDFFYSKENQGIVSPRQIECILQL